MWCVYDAIKLITELCITERLGIPLSMSYLRSLKLIGKKHISLLDT